MNRIRSAFVLVALLALSLPIIMGASDAADAQEGVGDASASLVGAHLEVEDLDGLTSGLLGELLGELSGLDELDTGALTALDTHVDLGLIEGRTSATTRDAPDARASLSPLRIGDERPYDISAGPGEEQSADPVDGTPVSALLSNVGLSALGVSADTDEEHAIATIEALEADLEALGAAGLDLGVSGVVSEVTRSGASATQDLTVDGLVVGLGDVLPAELLAALPLDALLDVIAELGDAGLLEGVDGLTAQVHGLVDDIEQTLAALDALDLNDLEDVSADDVDHLLDVLALRAELEDIEDLDALVDTAIDLLTDVGGLLGLDAEDEEELEHVLDLLQQAHALDGVELDDDCLVDGVDDLTVELLEGLEDCVASAISQIDALVETLLSDLLDDLELGPVLDLLNDLVDDLLELEHLLGVVIPDLIDEIAGIDLLRADRLGLEVLAAADAEGGSTTVACELAGLQVMEQVVGDTTCTDGSLDGDVDGAVGDALGVLTGVLESLPGVSGIDGLRLDVLPVASEEVTTAEDGTVTARAHAVLLELVVPSVTIDPSPSDLLDDLLALDLSAVDELTTLVDDLLAQAGLDVLPTSERDQLVAALEAEVVDGLGGTLDEVVGQVTGLLDAILGLDVLDALGIPVRTPSVSLVLDPVSEASFTPAAADEPTDEPTDEPGDDPTDDPADDPTDDPTPVSDDPELPKTGGGLALVGLLAMLGAVGLRRTG